MPNESPTDGANNPHAESAGISQNPAHLEPHRGTLLIIFAILGWLTCPIFSLVAYFMAKGDMQKMRKGWMDRSGEGTTNAAKIISLINLLLIIIPGALGLLFFCCLGGGLGLGGADGRPEPGIEATPAIEFRPEEEGFSIPVEEELKSAMDRATGENAKPAAGSPAVKETKPATSSKGDAPANPVQRE